MALPLPKPKVEAECELMVALSPKRIPKALELGPGPGFLFKIP